VGLVVKKNCKLRRSGRKWRAQKSFAPGGAWVVVGFLPTVSLWAILGRRSAAGNGFEKQKIILDKSGRREIASGLWKKSGCKFAPRIVKEQLFLVC
jgi:hypothetical protein